MYECQNVCVVLTGQLRLPDRRWVDSIVRLGLGRRRWVYTAHRLCALNPVRRTGEVD